MERAYFLSLSRGTDSLPERSAAGRAPGVVRARLFLQELIHRLDGLIVAVENLQVFDGRRSLGWLFMEDTREIRYGAATEEQDKRESTCECRPKLAASAELKVALQAFQPTSRSGGLLFPEANRELLIEEGGGLGSMPDIEEVERCLEGLELLVAGVADREMSPGREVRR